MADDSRITLPFKNGERIFLEGDQVRGLFFIHEGQVKVFNSGIRNKTQIIRFANTGQILGHRGFGKSGIYPVSATAIDNSLICFFQESDFWEIVNHNPQLLHAMLNFLADELKRADNKLRSLSQLNVKQKLAESILTLAEIYGYERSDDGDLIKVQLSRQEYAEIIGASVEEVIRTFSQLKKAGIICLVKKKVGIKDWKRLQDLILEFNQLRLP